MPDHFVFFTNDFDNVNAKFKTVCAKMNKVMIKQNSEKYSNIESESEIFINSDELFFAYKVRIHK